MRPFVLKVYTNSEIECICRKAATNNGNATERGRCLT
ncbi:hypothetical protein M5D96_011264 [Drosophila gunungcola]|uniref:Uncharacterized protein n=1 Tax=Drosophila gunungcola TaxID=103775 RepID=A0A9P9YFH5_9MUSC|nr:hypothetical protein M5D96_011264 [Drosophila gunungcola]